MSDEEPTKKASGSKQDESPRDESPDVSKLTPEEQMALYEEDLKETDWGHQPC